MNIQLLEYSPLNITAFAIRTCWDSHSKSDNGGEKDKELIDRVGNKYKHRSTLSHLIMSFSFEDIKLEIIEELLENRYINISSIKTIKDNKILCSGIITINVRSLLDILEKDNNNYINRIEFILELEKHIPEDYYYLLKESFNIIREKLPKTKYSQSMR